MPSWRQYLARHLIGTGLDLGPGHIPFEVLSYGTQVRYVDRWDWETNTKLFPDLPGENFPRPHYVVDLNEKGLSPFGSESEDFVIASHVLEHLANPLWIVEECHRVLRPGGVLLILLPSREHLWLDSSRPGTTLDHLIAEYETGVTGVDDEHVREALLSDPTLGPELAQAILAGGDAIQPLIDGHRDRSVHAHCWTFSEFTELLAHSILAMGQRWDFVDGLLPGHPGADEISFGFVLRKSLSDLEPASLAARFGESIAAWKLAEQVTPVDNEVHEATEPDFGGGGGQLPPREHDSTLRTGSLLKHLIRREK